MIPALPETLIAGTLPSALAPMQDVTNRSFMRLLGDLGPPDYFFTEYFRVHEHSTPEPTIIDSILHHQTRRPVFAQLIGENLFHLRRTARLLQQYPIAGIDLNMGCPAPKVYRKNVGGGLLRDPDHVERILATLRETCRTRFTVKMRIGFEDDRNFTSILRLVSQYEIDALSLHGRTVKQMYRGAVDYERIRQAVESVPCPVFANGNITSAAKAMEVREQTGCHGVMIGRSAIRNPWIFRQVRELSAGQSPFFPTLGDLRGYVDKLWATISSQTQEEIHGLNRLKKFLNFVGQGVDPEGRFLHQMRRTRTLSQLFSLCDAFMINDSLANTLLALEPFDGVHARPNHEGEPACTN